MGSYRDEVARFLRRMELDVRDQSHFRQGGASLLETLRDYIRDCDSVVLLVGATCGAFPSDEHVSRLGSIPVFSAYKAATGNARASYAQWEFILAKTYGKSTYVFITGPELVADNLGSESGELRACQSAYRAWIAGQGEDRRVFNSREGLLLDVAVLSHFRDSKASVALNSRAMLAPLLPQHFVPRPNLTEQLLEKLTAGSSRADEGILAITALHGLGGLGKSATAIALARSDRVRVCFPDGVLWARLGREPQIIDILQSWIRYLGEEQPAVWSVESASAYLRRALADRTVLIVLDDIWDESHAGPLCVGSQKSQVLITTRRAHVADYLNANVFALPAMTSDEAVTLIQKRAGTTILEKPTLDPDRVAAYEIADSAGYLPLALELIGALIAKGMSWREARRQLALETRDIDPSLPYESRSRRKLEACLALSLRALAEEDPFAWQCFGWLGVTPPGETIRVHMAATLWDTDTTTAERVLEALCSDSMIQRGDEGYVVHDLMHQISQRLLLEQAPTGLGFALATAHRLLLERYLKHVSDRQWATLIDDGYIHANLSWHLEKSENYSQVVDLVCTFNNQGRNTWYLAREKLGQIGGFLGDVKRAITVGRKHNLLSIGEEIRLSLTMCSVNGTSANMSESVLTAIAGSQLWSPFRCYQWIVEVSQDEARPELLVGLAEALCRKGITATKGMRAVRTLCLATASDMLLKKLSSDRSVKTMARCIALMERAEQHGTLSRALPWAARPIMQLELIAASNGDVRGFFSDEFCRGIHTETSGMHETGLLARAMPLMSGALLERWLPIVLSRVKGHASPSVRGSEKEPGRQRRASKRSRPGQQRGNPGESRKIVSELPNDPIFLESIVKMMANVPLKMVDEAANCCEFIGMSSWRTLAVEALDRIRGRTSGDDDDLDMMFRHLLQMGDAEGALRLALESNRLDPVRWVRSVIRATERQHLPKLFLRVVAYLTAQRYEVQAQIAQLFIAEDPELLAPKVLALLLEDPSQIEVVRVVAQLERRGQASEFEAPALIHLGYPDLSRAILRYANAIKDSQEIGLAMIGLLPFLPVGFPKELILDLGREKSAGTKIAILIQIMADLSSAVGPGDLPDIVEAASKLHSEWWVVEALTLTARRIRRVEEFAALLRASKRLSSLPYRARLAGRIGRRAADLGHRSFALSCTRSIELESARWDELRELAGHFAANGELQGAREAAAAIEPLETRSRAFAEMALELGAQGQLKEARAIVAYDIPLNEWKIVAMRLMGPASIDERDHEDSRTEARLKWRSVGEGSVTASAQVREAVENLSGERSLRALFGKLQQLARDGQENNLSEALRGFWRSQARDAIFDWIAAQKRAKALQVLAQLAPLIFYGHGHRDVVESVHAIKDACVQWP